LQKPEGKQNGKIDPILRNHQWKYPGILLFDNPAIIFRAKLQPFLPNTTTPVTLSLRIGGSAAVASMMRMTEDPIHEKISGDWDYL